MVNQQCLPQEKTGKNPLCFSQCLKDRRSIALVAHWARLVQVVIILLLVIGWENLRLFLSLVCIRVSTLCLSLQTFLILRVQQRIKPNPEPLGPRRDWLLMAILRNLDLLRKLDLHFKDLFLRAPLVLRGVVASSFLILIEEARPQAPRLKIAPGLMFGFWDLILGVQIMQPQRYPQQSFILKRKWLLYRALARRRVRLVPSRRGPTIFNPTGLNIAIKSPPPMQIIGRDHPRELLIIDMDTPRTAVLRLPEGATDTDHLPAMIHITGQNIPGIRAMRITTGALGTITADAHVGDHDLQLGIVPALSGRILSLGESLVDVLSLPLAPLPTGIAIQENIIALPHTIPLHANLGLAVLALPLAPDTFPAAALAEEYQALGSHQVVVLKRKTPPRGIVVVVPKATELLLVPAMGVWVVNLGERIRFRDIMHPLVLPKL